MKRVCVYDEWVCVRACEGAWVRVCVRVWGCMGESEFVSWDGMCACVGLGGVGVFIYVQGVQNNSEV